MIDPRDIETLLRDMRKDLTFAQAKITEALELVARLPVPADTDMVTCAACGVQRRRGVAFAEHMENVHGLTPAVTASQ